MGSLETPAQPARALFLHQPLLSRRTVPKISVALAVLNSDLCLLSVDNIAPDTRTRIASFGSFRHYCLVLPINHVLKTFIMFHVILILVGEKAVLAPVAPP